MKTMTKILGAVVLFALAWAVGSAIAQRSPGSGGMREDTGPSGTAGGPIYMGGNSFCLQTDSAGHCWSVDGTTMQHTYAGSAVGTVDQDGRQTGTVTLDDATGNEIAYLYEYSTNKAAGDDIGFKIKRTADTSSPGTSYLFQLWNGGVPVHYILDTGVAYYGSNVQLNANLSLLGGGSIISDVGDITIAPGGSDEVNISSAMNVTGLTNIGTAPFVPGHSPTGLYVQGSVEVDGVVWFDGAYLVPPRILSTSPSEPVACGAGYDGAQVYVDDTDDTSYGAMCICANLDGTGYDWRDLSDIAGTACPFF